MSRALGDAYLKHVVIPDPEVHSMLFPNPKTDEFCQVTRTTLSCSVDSKEILILASDGLWDVLENEEAVDILLQNPHLLEDPQVTDLRPHHTGIETWLRVTGCSRSSC